VSRVLVPSKHAGVPRQQAVPFPGASKWSNPVWMRPGLSSPYARDFTAMPGRASLDRVVRNRGFSTPSTSILVPGGGQPVEVYFDTQGAAVYWQAPPGDWEIVVEFSGYSAGNGGIEMVGPFTVDASGTGQACTQYNNPAGVVNWGLSSWAYASSGNTATWTGGPFNDQRRMWQTLRKSGTAYTGKHSDDGSTWTSYQTANTWAGTPVWIGVGRFYTAIQFWWRLWRVTVWPGPTFFPG